METVLQVAALCLLGTVLATLLRGRSPELALLLTVGVCVVVGALLLRGLGQLLSLLRELVSLAELSPELFEPLLKTLGIALLCRVGSDVCRDAGQSALASLLEIACSFAAVLVSLPLFQSVWELLRSLL